MKKYISAVSEEQAIELFNDGCGSDDFETEDKLRRQADADGFVGESIFRVTVEKVEQ